MRLFLFFSSPAWCQLCQTDKKSIAMFSSRQRNAFASAADGDRVTLLAETTTTPAVVGWAASASFRFRWNVVMVLVFGSLTVGVWADTTLGNLYDSPLFLTRWTRGDSVDAGAYAPVTHVVAERVPLGYLLVVFLGLAAVDHACTAIWQERYETQLRNGYNHFRLVEFSITPAAMMVLIAMLSGVLDVIQLVAIVALTNACMWLGLNHAWRPHSLRVDWTWQTPIAWWLFLAAWSIILTHFGMNIEHATSRVPDFVIAIVATLLFLMCLFGVNQVRPVASFYEREWGYLILSPTAKLMLAGLAYGGMRAR